MPADLTWEAMAAVASVVLTGFGVIYRLGKLTQRIDSMSEKIDAHADTRERLARLEAVVFHRDAA